MSAPLSVTMAAALQMAKDHGGQLERWPGGFWTYPGCPFTQGTGQNSAYRIPAWYVGTQTVEALRKRGLVFTVEKKGPGFRTLVQVAK